jgi:hypothetical protein
MEWLSENWFWVLILIFFVIMHKFGHGGHGMHGHGGHHEHGGGSHDHEEEGNSNKEDKTHKHHH